MISDKISHFFSGTLFTLLGMCLYLAMAQKKAGCGAPNGIVASYGLFFSLFIGVCWEFIEMMDFVFLGNDSQKTLTTGVFDTMYDLLACFLASIICAAGYVLWRKKGIKLLTGWVMEEFCQVNDVYLDEK